MTAYRAREISSNTAVKLIVVESKQMHAGSSLAGWHFYGSLDPIAVIVALPGGGHALGMDGGALDLDTPLWLDAAAATPPVVDFLRFETGCPLAAEPKKAAFALIAQPGAMPDLARFAQGAAEHPDLSATCLLYTSPSPRDRG